MNRLPDSLVAFEALHRLLRGQRLTSAMSKVAGALEVARALQAVRRACFLIYDPRVDPELARQLSILQRQSDRLLGSGMLLLVAVDPAPEGVHETLKTDASAARTVLLGDNLGFEPLASLDPSATARAMSMLFGVPRGMGSTLVVVDSLGATGGWMLATSAAAIGSQIAYLADCPLLGGESRDRDRWSDRPLRRVDAIGAVLAPLSHQMRLPLVAWEWGVSLDRLMLAVLRSVAGESGLEMASRRRSPGSSDSRDPMEELDRALRGDSERAVLRAGAECILEARGRGDVVMGPVGSPLPTMSEKARGYLAQGDELLAVIDRNPSGLLDYRPPALCYALAAEHELAEVLGHDVREGLGVALPEYFWKVQPGLSPDSIEVGDGFPIPFNQRSQNTPKGAAGLWQPPTIGGLHKGWKRWFPSSTRAGLNPFLERWNSIAYRRNPLAHPGDEIDKPYATTLRSDVIELIGMFPEWRP